MSQPRLDYTHLSTAERIQLAEDIWDSVVAESPAAAILAPDQVQEIQRRLQAHDRNPSEAVSWQQVQSELLTHRR